MPSAGRPRSNKKIFTVRAQLQLERPGGARLLEQRPIRRRDRIRIEQRLVRLQHVGIALARWIDHAVEYDVGDVDVLRPQLPRQRIRQPAQGKLRARKIKRALTTANGGGRSSEKNSARPG